MTIHRAAKPVLTLGLFLLAGRVALAAEPAPSLLQRMNPFASRDAGPRLRAPVAPLSAESLLACIRAEKDAYSRRLDACHRLREIAMDANDDTLEAKANELERLATETYRMRVSRLGVSSGSTAIGAVPTDAITSAKATQTLDATLGRGAAVTPLTAAKPAAKGTATAKLPAYKEVNP